MSDNELLHRMHKIFRLDKIREFFKNIFQISIVFCPLCPLCPLFCVHFPNFYVKWTKWTLLPPIYIYSMYASKESTAVLNNKFNFCRKWPARRPVENVGTFDGTVYQTGSAFTSWTTMDGTGHHGRYRPFGHHRLKDVVNVRRLPVS